MISHSELLLNIHYDPDTGIFSWRKPRKHVSTGQRAGSLDKDGYRCIKIRSDGKPKVYRAARLAIFYMTGDWPAGEADHRNLVKDDDSYDNVRPATKSQNMANTSVRADSSTGLKGVQRHGNLFYAKITVDKKIHRLGSFAKSSDATEAYRVAAITMRGEFARTS